MPTIFTHLHSVYNYDGEEEEVDNIAMDVASRVIVDDGEIFSLTPRNKGYDHQYHTQLKVLNNLRLAFLERVDMNGFFMSYLMHSTSLDEEPMIMYCVYASGSFEIDDTFLQGFSM